MKTDPKLLSQHLSQHHLLRPFLARAKKIIAINELLPKILPTESLDHSRAMNITDENVLIIEVDSAVWVTRLRYIEQILLEKLRSHPVAKEIRNIQYRVRASVKPAEQLLQPPSPRPLTDKSHQIIHELSHCVSCPELKAVLLRLLNT